MTTTHILHVFSTFAPGGTQRRTVDVFHSLPDQFRHTLLAIDNNWSAREMFRRPLPVDFVEVPKDSRGRVKRPELRAVLRKFTPHLMITYNWGAMEAIQALAFHRFAPILHAQDGFGPDEAKHQLTRRIWARRVFLRFCEALVVPSRNLERIGLDLWWLPPRRVLYIANGIDCQKYGAGDAAARARFRAKHNIPETTFTVGMVAHLRKEKNPGRLVRAFAKGAPADAILVFVGEGPERREIQRASHELGVFERIRFAGHVNDPEEAYKALDVFALCSDTEQMPISVLEAMSVGIPVVSTDVGDVKNMVVEPNRPFITALGDDEAMANSISELAADSALRARIGAANRARCVSQYSLEQQNNAYRDLYDRFSQPKSQIWRSEQFRA